MEYQIIEGMDGLEVSEDVNEEAKDGWRPIGGVAMVVYFLPTEPEMVRFWYSQAMYRE